MDIELEKLKKLEHALCDTIDILRDWQVTEAKPEEERFIAYLARPKYKDCYLTACAEGMWEAVQKEFDAKTKLFVGTCDEAVKWYESREKFTEIIKAWEDGKRIQVTPKGTDKWVDLHCEPTWDIKLEYRVKPEEKQYRPYESSAEMIADFIDRFNANCPSYCEPLIWVKGKGNDNRFLVTGISPEFGACLGKDIYSSFNTLFNYYTYLDGSPVGMEAKE